ncbi:MAG TPA: hypothetical protein VFN57_16440 [Thermomicrobiaceae bacterium]|nr:hypothetical protein [Thermomicrobiaceae bacterium]
MDETNEPWDETRRAEGEEVPPEVDGDETDTGLPGIPGGRAFLDAVRREAGWRVSPREAAAAIEAVTAAGEEPNPARVAAVAAAVRGDRSQRQRRHADLWRALGAQLAIHEQPAGPEAQRAFVGAARAAARREVSDALLLRVAVEVGAAEAALTPRLVGAVTRRVVSRGGRHLEEDELAETVREVIPLALAALAEEPAEETAEADEESDRPPERGWWRPRPRPSAPARPQVRRKRRAKPAGRSRPRKRNR